MAAIHVSWDTLNHVGWDTMQCYVFCRETLGMFQKFREIFNGTLGTPQKKSAWWRRPMKSAVLTSPKNVTYLKRNRPKYDDAQNKKEKSIEKRQQSPQKETTAKQTQLKRAAPFNEEITIVVIGWRCGYLHDLHAEFAVKLTRNSFIEYNKCQRPSIWSAPTWHEGISLAKLRLRCRC